MAERLLCGPLRTLRLISGKGIEDAWLAHDGNREITRNGIELTLAGPSS